MNQYLKRYHNIILTICLIIVLGCDSRYASQNLEINVSIEDKEVIVGAERLDQYLKLIGNKRIAVVANHSSMISGSHLVDSLLSLNVDIKKVFSPEHGFRGDADAGELIKSEIDPKTSLPIISLYGKNKKPKKDQLKDVDLILFDLQDVGVRFYTYISTLHYVMEAAAESDIPLIVLDRPNPNAHYIDGPILETEYKSFVGIHPIPIVYGLTIGELSLMINGEGWLENNIECNLKVISCENYSHTSEYVLPIPPSPNLPNQLSIYLYPSLCLFEGTEISVGRGTEFPFQHIGAPYLKSKYQYFFNPTTTKGAKSPKYEGENCYGINLQKEFQFIDRNDFNELRIDYLIELYNSYPSKDKFFNNFFNLLAGQEELKKRIIRKEEAKTIRNSWIEGIIDYKKKRENYLIYND